MSSRSRPPYSSIDRQGWECKAERVLDMKQEQYIRFQALELIRLQTYLKEGKLTPVEFADGVEEIAWKLLDATRKEEENSCGK